MKQTSKKIGNDFAVFTIETNADLLRNSWRNRAAVRGEIPFRNGALAAHETASRKACAKFLTEY